MVQINYPLRHMTTLSNIKLHYAYFFLREKVKKHVFPCMFNVSFFFYSSLNYFILKSLIRHVLSNNKSLNLCSLLCLGILHLW